MAAFLDGGRLRAGARIALTVLGAVVLACGEPALKESPAPQRECPKIVWAKAIQPGADLFVIGSWNAWSEPGVPMKPAPDGWYVAPIDVPEGEYGYVIAEAGMQRIDAYNPLTTFRGDEEVSLLLAPACESPEIRVDGVDVRSAELPMSAEPAEVTIRATFSRGRSGSPLAPSSITVTPRDFDTRIVEADPGTGRIVVSLRQIARGRHAIALQAADGNSRSALQSVAAWVKPLAPRWEDSVIYQIMIDRFRASDGTALAPPSSPAHRAGGTLDGVRAEVEKGTFERLGVTDLWLSPPTTSPAEARIGLSGRLEEGYHGYWQLDSREVDPRLGGNEALERLVTAAHHRGLKIIVDVVPNHVYEQNPRYLLHRDHGWFQEGPARCVCGAPACPWSTHMETCWFTEFLPDYRHQHPDVMRETADDVAFWIRRFHVDGVRIDAVPMMPRAATRRIVHALRGAVAPATAIFALGEIFTGTDGLEMIRYYLGPDGLPSAFDFPFMWTVREAIATDTVGFDALDELLAKNETALLGSRAVLGRMLDNHDTSRFLTEASGETSTDPWTEPAPQPSAPEAYRRLELGLALLFTLPGIPVLYYGDEVALAGHNDPDSRRVMPDRAQLVPHQQAVLALTERLGALRSKLEPLRSGIRKSWLANRDSYAFTRKVDGAPPVLVVLSKSAHPSLLSLPRAALPPGRYIDVFNDGAVVAAGDAELTIAMPPLSFRVLVPEALVTP